MAKASSTKVVLNITYDTATKEMAVKSNARPKDIMEILAGMTAQMAQAFGELDTAVWRLTDENEALKNKSAIIVPPPGLLVARS